MNMEVNNDDLVKMELLHKDAVIEKLRKELRECLDVLKPFVVEAEKISEARNRCILAGVSAPSDNARNGYYANHGHFLAAATLYNKLYDENE